MADAYTLSVLLNAKDNASPAIDKVDSRMGKLANNFQKHRRTIGATMMGIGGAVMGGLALSIKNASDLEESINAVNVVFKGGANTILEFGKTSATSTGLSSRAFQQMSAQIGALLMDTGLSMEDVADKTTEIAVRSADMASVMNTDVEQAFSAINQALRGETEAIRVYTGNVTEAEIAQYALSQGITKSVKDMSEQEKRLLRLEVVFEDTDKFAGDFQNTLGSLANQMKVTGALTENTSAAVGNALMPAITNLMNELTPLIISLTDWMKANPELTNTIVKVGAAIFALMIPMGALIMSMTLLNLAMAPITGTILAIMAVVVAAIVIWKKWDDMSVKLKIAIGLIALALGPLTAIVFGLIAAIKAILYVKNNWQLLLAKIKIRLIDFQLWIEKVRLAIGKWTGMSKEQEKRLEASIDLLEKNKKANQDLVKEIESASKKTQKATEQATNAMEDDWEGTTRVVVDGVEQQIMAQEALGHSVTQTADTFKKGAVTISRVSEENVRFARMVADNWEETSRRMNDSFEDMDDGYSVTLRNMQKREEQFTASREYFSNLRMEVEKKERETQREIWQQKAKDMQEAQRQMEEDQKRQTERLTENWARVGEAFDETLINWKRSGADTADVVRLWATRMKISTDDVMGQLIAMEVDTSDVHAVLQAFAERTGTSFFKEFNKAKDAVKGLSDEMQTLVTAFETLTGEKNPLAGVKLFPSSGEGFDPDSTLQQRLGGTMMDARVKKELDRFDAGQNFADYVEALFEEQGKRNPFGVQNIGTANVSAAMTRQNISNVAARAMNRGQNVFDAVIEAADSALTEQATNAIAGGYISATEAIKEGRITEEQAKTRGLIKEVVDQVEEQVKQETPSPIDFDLEGGFANGGRVKRGGLAMVGERGPEIVSLPGGSFVHPNGTGPGGGVTNQFHFHGAVYGVEDLKEVVVEAVRDHAISGGFQGVFQEA
jgi:hypothetical protein